MGATRKDLEKDDTFGYSKGLASGELTAKGIDQWCLGVTVEILRRTHKVEVNVGAPQLAYRETLARATEISDTHMKQSGGTGQFARVKLRLEPNEPRRRQRVPERDRRRCRAQGVHPA
jgi:elongation factor G